MRFLVAWATVKAACTRAWVEEKFLHSVLRARVLRRRVTRAVCMEGGRREVSWRIGEAREGLDNIS